MTTVARPLMSTLTGQKRDSLWVHNAAVSTTVVIKIHDAKGTTRNGTAIFEPGGA
jgi:hypothetical protein